LRDATRNIKGVWRAHLSLWHEFGDALNPEQETNERSFRPTLGGFYGLCERSEMIKTFKKLSQRQGPAMIFLTCVTLLSGCAALGFKQPEPVTVGQVIEMSKEGMPAEAIVEKMRDSETVYRLTAAQLAELHDVGIADQVLDYMQRTYIEAERREQSRDDWGEWNMWGAGF
jgi:hypothetical protein